MYIIDVRLYSESVDGFNEDNFVRKSGSVSTTPTIFEKYKCYYIKACGVGLK